MARKLLTEDVVYVRFVESVVTSFSTAHVRLLCWILPRLSIADVSGSILHSIKYEISKSGHCPFLPQLLKQWTLKLAFYSKHSKLLNLEEKQQSWLPVVWFYCLVKIVEFDISNLIKRIFKIIFYTWKQQSRFKNVWPHDLPRNCSNAHSFRFAACIQKWTIFMNNQIIIQIKFNKIIFMISRSRYAIVKT